MGLFGELFCAKCKWRSAAWAGAVELAYFKKELHRSLSTAVSLAHLASTTRVLRRIEHASRSTAAAPLCIDLLGVETKFSNPEREIERKREQERDRERDSFSLRRGASKKRSMFFLDFLSNTLPRPRIWPFIVKCSSTLLTNLSANQP